MIIGNPNELYHYGVLGMKWDVRRYQPYSTTGGRKSGKKGKEIGEAAKRSTRHEKKINKMQKKRQRHLDEANYLKKERDDEIKATKKDYSVLIKEEKDRVNKYDRAIKKLDSSVSKQKLTRDTITTKKNVFNSRINKMQKKRQRHLDEANYLKKERDDEIKATKKDYSVLIKEEKDRVNKYDRAIKKLKSRS